MIVNSDFMTKFIYFTIGVFLFFFTFYFDDIDNLFVLKHINKWKVFATFLLSIICSYIIVYIVNRQKTFQKTKEYINKKLFLFCKCLRRKC